MIGSRALELLRGSAALVMLALIVAAYRFAVHVNPTTVALTLLLYILLIAARLGLRYAVIISLIATACYNFFFLPPINTFTISDPQNWVALSVFLVTGIIGSRLSEQARDEALHAKTREREVDLLFALSRELLQSDNLSGLVSTVPEMILGISGGSFAILFLLDGDRIYQAGVSHSFGAEGAHLRQLALGLPEVEHTPEGVVRIPLRAGVRPRGLLVLADLRLSDETYQAIGGLVSVAIDRVQALENVSKAEANKESERLRTLILDSITHELRTPLTSIKGAAGALLGNASIGESDRTELLTVVDEETDRLNRLVGQAVEMAQLEARDVRMNVAPAEMAELIRRATTECAWSPGSHPATVALPPLPMVSADSEMIGKVLCNLLENAAKYSKAGSPIYISAEQRDGMVFTSVADRGIGIDAAEQGLIFDRLYRSRYHSSSVPGTGMGLAISRAIVESHGGTLTVTSQVDHGSVFTFSLPAVR